MKALAKIYIAIGACFSLPVAISYVYASWYIVWHTGLPAILGGGGVVMVTGLVIFPVVRAFLWLPSVVGWVIYGQISFLQWLAPGIFIAITP